MAWSWSSVGCLALKELILIEHSTNNGIYCLWEDVFCFGDKSWRGAGRSLPVVLLGNAWQLIPQPGTLNWSEQSVGVAEARYVPCRWVGFVFSSGSSIPQFCTVSVDPVWKVLSIL